MDIILERTIGLYLLWFWEDSRILRGANLVDVSVLPEMLTKTTLTKLTKTLSPGLT